MNRLMTAATAFAQDEEGITAIEYGLIAAVMAAAVVLAFGALGTGLKTAFDALVLKLNPPA
jgi:pilus assembly protein Flp/PilA